MEIRLKDFIQPGKIVTFVNFSGSFCYFKNTKPSNHCFLMSLIFEGRFHTFSPKTYLSNTGLTLIRPLVYIDESRIIGFQNKYQLPVVKNLCPADGFTRREEMKQLVREMNKRYPDYKERVFTAITQGGLPDWEQRTV